MMKRGALIVFEGCDRSGKSTQCQKLMNWLQQNDVAAHAMRFPGISMRNVFVRCSFYKL